MISIMRGVTTLYIDDTSLKLLVAKDNEVKKWATLPLESGLVKDGLIVERTAVADKIKEFFKAQKVGRSKVITCLSGLHCLFRTASMPRLPASMLKEGVMWEAKRVLPVPLEEFYISWQIMPVPGEEMQVFLAALPRNAVDSLIETLKEAKVKSHLMDVAPLALARAVSNKTALVVDVRSTEIDIVTVIEGIPQLIRSVHLPGEAPSLREKLPTVREELKRTIKFYNSSHQEEPLGPDIQILASGELGDDAQACQSLAEALNYSVLPLSSPLKCRHDTTLSQYMVNIGLALKKLPPGKKVSLSLVNINFLPEVYRPKPPVSRDRMLAYLGLIVAACLLGSLLTLVQSTTAATEQMQSQVDIANLLLQKRYATQASLKKEIAELEQQIDELTTTRDFFTGVLDDFGRRQEMVYGDLELATRPLPSSIALGLTDVTHMEGTLTVSGTAQSETDVLAYSSSLRASKRFSQVLISFLQLTEIVTETETGTETETFWKFTLILQSEEKS